MATARLVPSTYYLSNSSYLRVSNANSMYENTDDSDYATVTNSQNGTTTYYIYLRGFNFDAVPSSATVTSFTVKLKARESGINTSSSYAPKLCHGTSQITSTCTAITTSVTTHTFTNVGADWADLVEYGDDFGIRINCRRSSRNTTGYMYIYGAEILVEYTVPNPATVTSSLVGNGIISPSGAYDTYDDAEYELTIKPDDISEQVTITKDGIDVTSELVAHGVGQTVTVVPEDVTTSGIQSGASYAEYAIGNSAEDPSTSGSSSNMYASSSSTGYAAYTFDFSSIPSNAKIEEVSVRCYGHRESSTIDSTHVSSVALFNGNTQISEDVNFPSLDDTIITVEPTDVISRSELDNISVRHYVGYYGGLILGISFVVTYSIGSGIDHYTYTYIVNGDATIVVTIGTSTKLYMKSSGSWVTVDKVYLKINGAWVEQTDLENVFNTGYSYVHKS